jgi:hypothetical protein
MITLLINNGQGCDMRDYPGDWQQGVITIFPGIYQFAIKKVDH